MDFPIYLHIPDLKPVDGSLRGITNSIIDNMSGFVESGILDAEELQQSGIPAIDSNQSPETRIGNIVLRSVPTEHRNQTPQNKDGVVATLDDVYGIRETVTLQEGLVSVDWDKGSTFKCVLSPTRQSSFYMQHSRPGMKIKILLVNSGTSQTVVWDPVIQWPGGTEPGIPASPPGASAGILATIRNIGGVLYGESQGQPSMP